MLLGKKCNVRDVLEAKTYQFSFPVFPFEQSAALCAVVVVDVQRVGEGTEESALAFDELHVPAAPDHVVQPEGMEKHVGEKKTLHTMIQPQVS